MGVNRQRIRNVRPRTVTGSGFAFGPVTLKFITIIVLALLTLIYLIQSTKGSGKVLQVTDLEQKKEALENQREDLELEAVRLKTLQRLKDATRKFNLEPVTSEEQVSDNE